MSWTAIVAKDLRVELRGKEILGAVLLLALFLIVTSNLAFGDRGRQATTGAAVLWITLVFALSLGIALTFTKEVDRGTLRTLLSIPTDVSNLYLAKVATNVLLGAVLVAVVLPAYALFFSAGALPGAARLAVVLLLGVVGLAAVGTLLAAVAARTATREVLMPVLLFPLAVPLLMAGLGATERVLAGADLAAATPSVSLLVAYDATMLALGWLLFEYVVEV